MKKPPEMPPELEIEFAPEAKAQMDSLIAGDPAAAAVFAELFANMRQAHQAVAEGRYPSFDLAMEAITGERPERVDE